MIFLDSTYLIGLILKRDTFTKRSIELEPYLYGESKLINNTVFNEVFNSVTSNNLRYNLEEIKSLLLSYNVDILTFDDYLDAMKIFKHYNFSINFSDCTILKTMQDNNINKIVSFDSDFDKIKGIDRVFFSD